MVWPVSVNLALGFAFVGCGLFAAALQYWLWRFPMVPDPTGRDPNGVTTAPLAWRKVHRASGYLFIALYGALLTQMIPRLPYLGEYEEAGVWAHAVLGTAILPILMGKVLILRRWQRYGKSLPLFGTALMVAAVVIVALAAGPALRLATLPAELPAEQAPKAILTTQCMSCHGAAMIFKPGDDAWPEILDEMREKARKADRPDPTNGRQEALADYLQRVVPRVHEEGGGRRERKRFGNDEGRDED